MNFELVEARGTASNDEFLRDQVSVLLGKEESSIYYYSKHVMAEETCDMMCCACQNSNIESKPFVLEEIMTFVEELDQREDWQFEIIDQRCSPEEEEQEVMDVMTDETCRLKMSEWCYKICDYLGASRETVAIAFNYLDRFLTAERFTW